MGKVSLSVIKRPSRKEFSRTFTDPANAALSVTMQFRFMGTVEWLAVQDIAGDKASRYVTGYGDSDKPGHVPPENLPAIDNQPVYITESSCKVAAALEYAQTVAGEDRYTFEEIVGFMTVDAIAAQMIVVFNELQNYDDEATHGPLVVTPG